MLTIPCINPVLLSALASCGHLDTIHIASGNFPVDTVSPEVQPLFVGLRPGVPTTTDVLKLVSELVNIEKAEVMLLDGADPDQVEVFKEYREVLGDLPLTMVSNTDYYQHSAGERMRLAVSTGDVRPMANIIITVGVVRG